MFKAVRDFAFPSGFRWLRFRRAGRLFLFEFVVVLLGVLAAQMLQSWAADASARAETDQVIERSRAEALRALLIANYWLKVGPCLRDRVGEIARVAAEGGTLRAKDIGRPALPLPNTLAWPESTTLVARRIYGQQFVDRYASVALDASISRREQDAIARDWASFELLDPALGPTSASDRANVRLAATQIRASIRLLMVNGEFVRTLAKQMRIQPRTGQKLEVSGVEFDKVADNCGLLLHWSPS
jgi:hypothetical protein